MTNAERKIIINHATRCMERIREESDRAAPQWRDAAYDVADHLCFFVDWLRQLPVEEELLTREIR